MGASKPNPPKNPVGKKGGGKATIWLIGLALVSCNSICYLLESLFLGL
jgi:hypothetical protein